MLPLGLTTTIFGFEILRAEHLYALVAAPLALAVGMWALGARRKARRKLIDQRHESRFVLGFSPSRARLRVVLATTAVLTLGTALLGPVRGYTLREVQRRGLDLVVCVDTSRSMLVRDLDPDRLTRTKREVSALLDRLVGDRVALVAFSGDVRNVAPLTRDRETLRWFLNSLDPRDNLVGGTDIGAALEHALEIFDGRTGAHEAIVVLTDGEDLSGNGLEMAEEARARGIRVYMVGMGTSDGGKIPDARGGWVRGPDGEEVVSVLDGGTLQAIAQVTGGAYLSASNAALPLEELYDKRISQLEGRFIEDGKERLPHDRYQWALVVALACMAWEISLRERSRRRLRGARKSGLRGEEVLT